MLGLVLFDAREPGVTERFPAGADPLAIALRPAQLDLQPGLLPGLQSFCAQKAHARNDFCRTGEDFDFGMVLQGLADVL